MDRWFDSKKISFNVWMMKRFSRAKETKRKALAAMFLLAQGKRARSNSSRSSVFLSVNWTDKGRALTFSFFFDLSDCTVVGLEASHGSERENGLSAAK